MDTKRARRTVSSIGFGELPADPERRPNLNREPFGFACQSCGKDFSSHLGLVGTCADLTAARARIAELTESIADHKQVIEDKRARNKELRERVVELERENELYRNAIADFKEILGDQ